MELEKISGKILIYGAKSIALGVSRAVRTLFPEKKLMGFMVSNREGNPEILDELPVMELRDCKDTEKDDMTILIGTPETAHEEIIRQLREHGFFHYICVGWELEEKLMEQYYTQTGQFPALHALPCFDRKSDLGQKQDEICVFQVKSHVDCELKENYQMQGWIHGLQAGAANTELRIGEYADHTGENISGKNGNYCELTALYWIWKNVLETESLFGKYCGVFQYRRLLNIKDGDVRRISENHVDVVLPFPTIHEPDITEHHGRYIKEKDWMAMLKALRELQPEDAEAFGKLLRQPYFYNYNILVARKEILREYCTWLFPILKRTEELSRPKGNLREDRYIGYLGENLLTLYFMRRAHQLKIVHTGRKMLI